MRILVTGGGSGGHTSPAIAFVETLLKREPAASILYVGSAKGIEAKTACSKGIPFIAIQTGKLRRYFSLKTVPDLCFRLPIGILQALKIILQFKPDCIFSTGGYVSLPVVIAGRILKRPILIHEQTVEVGLANRIGGRLANRIAISFDTSKKYFPAEKVVLTGNPVRPEVLNGDRVSAAKRFGLSNDFRTIYVTGGVQGAHRINRTIAKVLRQILEKAQVIHQCGEQDFDWLSREAEGLGEEIRERYRLFRFIGGEIGDVFALTDLLVSRAGAGIVNEAAAMGKPAVFIPLPAATKDEQTGNAALLADVGAAVVILEHDLTPELLRDSILELVSNPAQLNKMGQAARGISKPDAAENLIEEIIKLANYNL
ncbi:MAG: undecaprenyldiphospho-muramoylpentapeptide beta-N-acetylglucosaminyltransferase [bacterium]|nr:undecaprenyldiphospho-muramoylpentapeptide beta-N-acetylglucosaminyltransferase [bacterium]